MVRLTNRDSGPLARHEAAAANALQTSPGCHPRQSYQTKRATVARLTKIASTVVMALVRRRFAHLFMIALSFASLSMSTSMMGKSTALATCESHISGKRRRPGMSTTRTLSATTKVGRSQSWADLTS